LVALHQHRAAVAKHRENFAVAGEANAKAIVLHRRLMEEHPGNGVYERHLLRLQNQQREIDAAK